MADPIGKIALRWARRLLIWPLEAMLVLTLFMIARLLPIGLASAIMGGLFGLIGPLTPWQARARRNLNLAIPDLPLPISAAHCPACGAISGGYRRISACAPDGPPRPDHLRGAGASA